MAHWDEGSGAPDRPAPRKESKPSQRPRTNIIPDKRLLVKALGFMAWTVQGDGDTWIEVYSNSFAEGVCVLDLETAQELLKVATASVGRLRAVHRPSQRGPVGNTGKEAKPLT